MKKEATYNLLVEKMHEVATVPVQEVGPFTFIYKGIVANLKNSPYLSLAIISFICAFFLYLLLGSSLIRLVSVLQVGF